jgi:hypothetical protein
LDEHEPPNEWTSEEQKAFRRAFHERRRRQVLAGQAFTGVLIALVSLGVLLRIPSTWWVPAVGLVAAAGLVFRLTNWKCPACGEVLPTRGVARACPGCGLPLESEND